VLAVGKGTATTGDSRDVEVYEGPLEKHHCFGPRASDHVAERGSEGLGRLPPQILGSDRLLQAP
jgi:hypothetical protein